MSIPAIPYKRPDQTGAFLVDFTFWQDGRKYRIRKRGFSSAREARTWADREVSRIRLGLPQEARRPVSTDAGDPRGWTTTEVFERLCEYWKASGRKRQTTLLHNRLSFRQFIEPLIGPKPFAGITQREVLAVMQMTAHQVNPRGSLLLRSMMRDARKIGAIAPDVLVEIPKIQSKAKLVWLEPGEVAQIRDALASHWRPVLLFAVATGLRAGELFGLQWADLDLKSGTATIRHNRAVAGGKAFWNPPKNGKHRTVYLSAMALKAIEAQKPVLNPKTLEEGRVFPFDTVTFFQALKRATKKAGIEKVISPHVLRHTFASLQVQNGVPLEQISSLLGHSSMTMTMKYAHLRPGQLQQAVDLLSDIVSSAL